MAQYEYKALQLTHPWLEFYTETLSSFGWSVDSMQEIVSGTQTSMHGMSMDSNATCGSAYIFPPTQFGTRMTGHAFGSSVGVQNSTSSTKVDTVLSVKFKRDMGNPLSKKLDSLEDQCRPHLNAYVARAHQETSQTAWAQWQAVNRYRLLAENLTVSGGGTLSAAAGEFSKVWLENNVDHGGEGAFRVHFDLAVRGRKDVNVQVLLRLMDKDGRPLPDANNSFSDLMGHVGAVSSQKPQHDASSWQGHWIQIPYSELHLKNGRYTLRYQLALVDISTDALICESEIREFFYEQSRKRMGSHDNDAPDPVVAECASFAPQYASGLPPKKKKTPAWVAVVGTLFGAAIIVLVFMLFFYPLMAHTNKQNDLDAPYNHSLWEQQDGNWAFVLEDRTLYAGPKGWTYEEIRQGFRDYMEYPMSYNFKEDGVLRIWGREDKGASVHQYDGDTLTIRADVGNFTLKDTELGLDFGGVYIRVALPDKKTGDQD